MKTALITGASRGIGKETAILLAQKGFAVAVNYNHSHDDALAVVKLIRENGGTAMAVKADVSQSGQVQNMLETTIQQLSPPEILVNNAAISHIALLTDTTEPEWDKLFNINVKGCYLTSKSIIPHMLHRGVGKIVNVSSIWGITGASCEVAYSATKGAIIAFTKALALELAPMNITVNCVAPGIVDTDMNKHLPDDLKQAIINDIPLSRMASPTEIAHTIAFLVSDDASYITGQIISPNGGYITD